jgi:predicted Zn-dependent peptidase
VPTRGQPEARAVAAERLPARGPTIRTISSSRARDRALVDIVVAVPVPPGTDRAALHILSQLLGQSAGGVRTRLGAAYGTGAFLDDDPRGATIRVVATVSADRAGDALRLIRDEMAALRTRGVERAAAFVRARRKVVEAMTAAPLESRTAAAVLAEAAAHGLSPADLSALTRRVAGTTLADLNGVAATLLRPEAQAIVLRGPDPAIRAALAAAGLAATGTASRGP